MRHRSSNNVDNDLALAEWPSSNNKVIKAQALFDEELDVQDEASGMAFDTKGSPQDDLGDYNQTSQGGMKFGKEDDEDSLVSGHSASRLQKKANLELVW